ncbi:MAG: ABC transporter permease [Treponema sp.]|jgi:spermidine/putrescine transport system permease protein|nr:ABC transporter permease [Treponema sp.]
MTGTLPRSKTYKTGFAVFITLYFLFLFAPLLASCVLAFNNSMFPSLPWKGFTLDWFFGTGKSGITGIFHDVRNLRSIGVSLRVAAAVSIVSTIIGVCAAFLFEQEYFRLKKIMYFLMIAPFVMPGVILGISILLFTNQAGVFFEEQLNVDIKFLRPGFWLVVLGQSSFISTFVALVVMARLKKFGRTLEDAARNLGAGRFQVIWHITLPYLRPSIIGAAAVSFSMSLENINTTLFLSGSETTLPINLYVQVRDGSTPVINAISFLLILSTSIFAAGNLCFSLNKK